MNSIYAIHEKWNYAQYVNHDNSHNIINYNDKNYICRKHNEKFVKYCKECKENICMLCQNEHKNHDNNI